MKKRHAPQRSAEDITIDHIRQHFSFLGNPLVRAQPQWQNPDGKKISGNFCAVSKTHEKFWTVEDVIQNLRVLRKENLTKNIFITLIETNYLTYRTSPRIPIFEPDSPHAKDVRGNLYILIDDIKNLSQFKQAFSPNSLVETSANNYQAVFVFPQIYEREVYVDLMFALNQSIGDKAINGFRHPFRLMGFTNRKKEREINGKAPFMKMISGHPGPDPAFVQLTEIFYSGWQNSNNKKNYIDFFAKIFRKMMENVYDPDALKAELQQYCPQETQNTHGSVSNANNDSQNAQYAPVIPTEGRGVMNNDFGRACRIIRQRGLDYSRQHEEEIKAEIKEKAEHLKAKSGYDQSPKRYVDNLYKNALAEVSKAHEEQRAMMEQCQGAPDGRDCPSVQREQRTYKGLDIL